MQRHIFLTVFIGTLLAVALAVFLPGREPPEPVDLPWQIEVTADGGSRVLGVSLGETPLRRFERRVGEEAKINLFAAPDGSKVVEGFFENVTLSGLRAKVVATAELTPEELEAIYGRGVRIATLGSGTRKVTLASDDLAYVRAAPVAALTYLPRSNLAPEVVEKRFGEPARKVAEAGEEGPVVHWLYPENGLDIAVSAERKEVLQYVRPDRFERLVAPLESGGESTPVVPARR